MAEISLAYHNQQISGSDLFFDNAIELFTDYAFFDIISSFPPSLYNVLSNFTKPNGSRGSQVLHQLKQFNFVISNNDISNKKSIKLLNDILILNSNDLSGFLIHFWNSQFKYFIKSNNCVFSGLLFKEVYSLSPVFPLSHIENILYLPKISFSLEQCDPVSVYIPPPAP